VPQRGSGREWDAVAWVTGVDGCRSGWIGISRDTQTGAVVHGRWVDGAALFAATMASRVIAIDIPIGLTERGARSCDRDARRLLGRPRGSSVFPAPIRAALAASSRAEADSITRRIDGRGVGAQAWNIYRRIDEIDRLLRAFPGLADRVCEAHPEVCFWALNGARPMRHSKHRPAGFAARRGLIGRHFGGRCFARVQSAYRRSEVAADDILDAFALCWTAERVFRGEARSLPELPPRDGQGLAMGIRF
jgi:predicted RNase H-like nuclease